jgi:hypothetical protein
MHLRNGGDMKPLSRTSLGTRSSSSGAYTDTGQGASALWIGTETSYTTCVCVVGGARPAYR